MKFFTKLSITFLCLSLTITAFSQNKANSIYEIDLNRYSAVNLDNMEFNAQVLFLQKNYEKAASQFLEIVNINIDDASSYYQLACCYAMLEKPQLAGNFLVLAINAGYNNYSQIKAEDSFKFIKKDEDFNTILNDVLSYGEKYGETIFVSANILIKSRVILPKNFDPTKEYPLLVGLHGFGGVAENFCMIYSSIDVNEFIFVVPEAPYFNSDLYNKKFQYSWDFRGNDKDLWKKSDPEVMNYIINVVDTMNEKYRISNNYLLGFSQGAAYAYATGIRNQDKIDAVIAFGGRLPDAKKYPWFLPDEYIQGNNKLKVLIAHGRNDKVINYKHAIEAKKKLLKNNYEVELILFDGGHSLYKDAVNNSLEWVGKACK